MWNWLSNTNHQFMFFLLHQNDACDIISLHWRHNDHGGSVKRAVKYIVYSGADQRKHQSSASLAFVRGIHQDQWIPHTKGQLRGKCFHLMTSSCCTGSYLTMPNCISIVWKYHGNMIACRFFFIRARIYFRFYILRLKGQWNGSGIVPIKQQLITNWHGTNEFWSGKMMNCFSMFSEEIINKYGLHMWALLKQVN